MVWGEFGKSSGAVFHALDSVDIVIEWQLTNLIFAVDIFVFQQCRDPQVRANYLYLRGIFYAAQSSTMKALDDLLSIQSAYSRLLPVE